MISGEGAGGVEEPPGPSLPRRRARRGRRSAIAFSFCLAALATEPARASVAPIESEDLRAGGRRIGAPAHETTKPKVAPDRWSVAPIDATRYFTAEEMADWAVLARSRRALSLAAMVLSVMVYALLGFTRARDWLFGAAVAGARRLAALPLLRACAGGRLSAALARLFGPDWAAATLFTWLVVSAVALAMLPLQIVAEHYSREAGLSVYTTAAWYWDLLKGLALTVASFTFLALGVFGLVRRMPGRWWLVLGLPAALFLVGWGVVSPYQARVFHEFSALDDGELRGRFEALANTQGLTLAEVRVVNASRHTRALNAYITGLGPSRELVLFDTLLRALEADEIEAVVAHELGHVERENVALRYSLSGLALLAILWLLSRVLLAAAPRLGLSGPGDARALPLLLFVVTVCFLAARPIERAYLRHEERLADRAGLMMTRNPDAFVRMIVSVARHNKADVDPPAWARLWFSTHPPVIERIGVARWYESWLDERAVRPMAAEEQANE